tara:strand:- start:20 stop:247 length:228 start_codon:yes stop_codon:yes gene_type:complete
MGAVTEVDDRRLAGLNVQYLLERLVLPEAYKLPWSGEDTRIRLKRRAETWTPVIEWGLGLALAPKVSENPKVGGR